MTFDAAPTDLTGKTCLVTGANGGIGATTAAHFVQLGAHVLTTDIGDSFTGEATTTYVLNEMPDAPRHPTFNVGVLVQRTCEILSVTCSRIFYLRNISQH